MRSIPQRGPGPVAGPVPDPGPRQRRPTQRHWRPIPEPGTAQQAHRAGASSAEPETAEWLTMGGLKEAPALLPAPAVSRNTVMIKSNLGFISFFPQLPPQAIGSRRLYSYANPAHDASSLRMIVP